VQLFDDYFYKKNKIIMIYVIYFEVVRKAHVYKVANYGEAYDT
jgi:hypothetical protein